METRMKLSAKLSAAAASCALVLAAPAIAPAQSALAPSPARIEFYRVAHGFIPETKGADGWATSTGFDEAKNPWGQYTAYLMSTNARGQRSWRIEHYLPGARSGSAQGSTMYLLEGDERALLIDTANPAKFTPGVDDLKTVVRYLLAHENNGDARVNPRDFVVANTHNHGDHIGENVLMSDRTIYYMDGDWPANAPANYVPIREGGGKTDHGPGIAVGQIDLGNRTLRAVAIPPHTAGSTGYLDVENQMMVTGDALGSGWPYIQRGPIPVFARTAHHAEQVTRDLPQLVVLPSHFYQTASWDRGQPPMNARPLDRQYLIDMAKLADGVLDGSVIGEPFFYAGRPSVRGQVGTAGLVYSLSNIYADGSKPANYYKVVAIPGAFDKKWVRDKDLASVYGISTEFYQVYDVGGNVNLFLLKTKDQALLIGTGSGSPGLSDTIKRLAGGLPLDVAILSDDADQRGGLSQLTPRRVFAVANALPGSVRNLTTLRDGSTIGLGDNAKGKPVVLTANSLPGHSATGVTLTDGVDRLLFAGDALGMQGGDAGLVLSKTTPAEFGRRLDQWKSRTAGKYDIIYTAHNFEWYTNPAYVEELSKVVRKAAAGDLTGKTPSTRVQGASTLKSDGPATIVASIRLDGEP
jgi:glyoxylase-like metal-dependent hydrolase (beta-lactamase superfamily II)